MTKPDLEISIARSSMLADNGPDKVPGAGSFAIVTETKPSAATPFAAASASN
jgi:hypothetical protein